MEGAGDDPAADGDDHVRTAAPFRSRRRPANAHGTGLATWRPRRPDADERRRAGARGQSGTREDAGDDAAADSDDHVRIAAAFRALPPAPGDRVRNRARGGAPAGS